MTTDKKNSPVTAPMWWDGGDRAITAREKALIEEHGPSSFSIPLLPQSAWALDAEQYGSALNEASWLFVEQCPEKSALLFNSIKVVLRAAILRYAALVQGGEKPAELAEQQGDAANYRGVFLDAVGMLTQISLRLGVELNADGVDPMLAAIDALAATGKQQAGVVPAFTAAVDALHLLADYLGDAPQDLNLDHEISLREARDAIAYALAARQPGVRPVIPAGWKLVPEQMTLDPSAVDLLVTQLQADEDAESVDDRWCGGVLWVGETVGDQGETYYGLNFANIECMEEGSLPLVEFAAPPAQGIDLHRLVPPEWLSEQLGGPFDDLTPGQAWRQGFNQCRARALLLVEQAMGFPAEQQCDAVPRVDRA